MQFTFGARKQNVRIRNQVLYDLEGCSWLLCKEEATGVTLKNAFSRKVDY